VAGNPAFTWLIPKDRGAPHRWVALDVTVVKKLLAMMPKEALLELFSACIADNPVLYP